jgi:hypothetical protein
MAYKWVRSLDLTLKQLLNLKLQHISGDHSSTDSGVFYYDSAANRPAVRTNAAFKRVAFTDDVPGAGELDAADINYDNGVGSDLDATDVQAAIEELEDEKASTGSVTTVQTNLDNHINDTDDAHDAAAVSYAGGTGISATSVEGALDELATEKLDASALTDHLNDTTDAHDASAISVADAAGQLTATDVEAAIAETFDRIEAHEADTVDAHDATAISYQGSTNLAATTVEGALDELDTEKTTTSYVDTAIANLVDTAPGTLDTLNELAAALGDDPNFATTITNLINERGKVLSYDVGDNSATSFTFTHNLNTRDIVPSLRQSGSPWAVVGAEIDFPTVNTVRVQFDAPAPATDEYKLTIVGKQG